MTTQVRTSYLPSEILWGHSMHPLITYQNLDGRYKIDYTQFHETVSVDTPDMSPKEYASKPERSRQPNNNERRRSVTFTCPPALPKSASSASPASPLRRFSSSLKRVFEIEKVQPPPNQTLFPEDTYSKDGPHFLSGHYL